MRVELSVSGIAKCGLPKRFFVDIVKEALRLSALLKGDETVVVGAAFVSDDEMRRLNRTYRRKNKPTDILSFGEFRTKSDIRAINGQIELGDLVLSLTFIRTAAKEDGVSFEQEMAFIFSHGIFHLLGFRHSPRMFSMQDKIASVYSRSMAGKTKKS